MGLDFLCENRGWYDKCRQHMANLYTLLNQTLPVREDILFNTLYSETVYRVKVAEHSLIGCGSLPFIGVLYKSGGRSNAQIWLGQNILIRDYIY